MNGNIEHIIQNMSVNAKVGQLFLLAYPGKDPQKLKPLMEEFGIAGCYISQDNAETFAEARSSNKQLQEMNPLTDIPLLLGVDQEGAWGVLVPESMPGPGNLALGANPNPDIVTKMYQVCGEEMLSAGYNAIFAPCADVNTDPLSPIIGTRSFGGNPEHVANLVKRAVQGAHNAGILSTVKHFPGHGSTGVDTHRSIPTVDKSLEQLLKEDLLPFAAGIQAGAHIVMTSHILFPRIDAEYPATLSHIILQDILRKQLGFTGLVLSDSMNMGAIRKYYDPAESTLMALKAGVDLIMLSEEHYDHSDDYLKKQIASLRRVKQAVISGEISLETIHQKLKRILTLRMSIANMRTAAQPMSHTEKKAIVTQAAQNAITVIRDDAVNLPIPMHNHSVVCVNATPREAYSVIMNPRGIGPNQITPAYDSFRAVFSKYHPDIPCLELSEAQQQKTLLENAQHIIIITEDYPLPGEDMPKEAQQQFVKACLSAYQKKCIIVGLRSPYELLEYTKAYTGKLTYICSFSSRTCSAEETATLIAQGETPTGKNHIVFTTDN